VNPVKDKETSSLLMNNLPEDIISVFFAYLDHCGRHNYLLSLNRDLVRDYRETVERNRESAAQFIADKFHNKIIQLMGGMGKMLSCPAMEWEDKYMGTTDYIEYRRFGKSRDRISWGVDCFGRAFVVFRAIRGKYTRSTWPTANVLFQRYRDHKDRWSSSEVIFGLGGHFLANGHLRDRYNAASLPHNVAQIVNAKGNVCELRHLEVARQPGGEWVREHVKTAIILP